MLYNAKLFCINCARYIAAYVSGEMKLLQKLAVNIYLSTHCTQSLLGNYIIFLFWRILFQFFLNNNNVLLFLELCDGHVSKVAWQCI
jgi:hypothetical protein